MGDKEIKKAKKVFKDAWDCLDDFFDEKRSDTVFEKEKKAKKGKVALAKFKKGLIGKTNQINFRMLIGQEKEMGDHLYEAVYMDDKKEPYIYHFIVDKGKPRQNILTNFHDEDWNGYKKVQKYKSLTKFLGSVYKDDIYHKGKKYKKEEALNILIKKGLRRTLEAVEEDVKDKHGEGHPLAMKIAKIVAVAAVTTIISAALSPAAGVVLQNIQAGGGLGGNVLGEAAHAAGEGLKSVADPLKLAKKAVTKTVTKGVDLGD
jgi:hypothetical protein